MLSLSLHLVAADKRAYPASPNAELPAVGPAFLLDKKHIYSWPR